MIHTLASLPHYHDHVTAVFRHLPDHMRGSQLAGANVNAKRLPPDDVVIVGGFWDVERTFGRRTIYVEHGAGQSYRGDGTPAHPAYHGSIHPKNVVGYIAPRQDVAEAWGRPAAAVGCPIVDDVPMLNLTASRPQVTFAFHWRSRRPVIEAGSAMDYYLPHLGLMAYALREQGFDVKATCHPRDSRAHIIWRNLKVPVISAADARRSSSMLIADNTSLMYELAHLCRPVVALNAPEWRRHVDHGLRFWSAVPGTQIDNATQFVGRDWMQYMNSDEAGLLAGAGSLAAYDRSMTDHLAGKRAADFIAQLVGDE